MSNADDILAAAQKIRDDKEADRIRRDPPPTVIQSAAAELSPYQIMLCEKRREALLPLYKELAAIANPFQSIFPSRRKIDVGFDENYAGEAAIRASFGRFPVKTKSARFNGWHQNAYFAVTDADMPTYRLFSKGYITHPGEVFRGGGERLETYEAAPDIILREDMTKADVVEWYKQALTKFVADYYLQKSKSREALNIVKSKLGISAIFLAAALTASESTAILNHTPANDTAEPQEIVLEI